MKVNLDELQRQASAFRDAAQRLSEVQETLLHVRRAVDGESVTRKLTPAVEGAAGRAADEARDLRLLGTTLEQIADDYARCERDIRDRAQGDSLPPRALLAEVLDGSRFRVFPFYPVGGDEPQLTWTPWEPETNT